MDQITMAQITKKQLAEWQQREAAYYAEAEKWKQIEEKMKRDHDIQIAEWKRSDEAWAKLQRDQEEFNKYSEEEVKEAIRQIRIDRLKILLNPYVQ